MKILMVSSYLPYPLYDGGKIRLYNLLKFLKNEHEITLVCETRDNQSEKDLEEVRKVCKKVIPVPRKKQWSLPNIVRTGLSLSSFLFVGHKNEEMKRAIESELSKDQYNLIHVETSYVYQNLPKTKIPVVLAEHNIEYLVYQRYVENSSILLRPLLSLDILKLKKEEEKLWKSASVLIAVSEEDAKKMGRTNVKIVPNGVDTNKFTLKSENKGNIKKLLFIGDFKWIQNRDSASYIIKNIWPKLLVKNKDFELKLWIVGKNIPQNLRDSSSEKVILDESATDKTEEIFQKADLLIAPIRVGGGTKFKILESMSCGTPVLTNNLGNEGIGAKNNEEILICETPEEYAEKAFKILNDGYLYKKISRNGRKYIEEDFDWKNIASKLDKIYKGAVL